MSALAASEEFRREVQDQEPHGVAFVAEDPDGRIVGEAYAAALGEGSAEVAFVVADGWQHHGVGTLLRAALFEQLRADRIVMVFAELLPENRAMMEADRTAAAPIATASANVHTAVLIASRRLPTAAGTYSYHDSDDARSR
jgi:GNAT superfamily N-acetyltransferase